MRILIALVCSLLLISCKETSSSETVSSIEALATENNFEIISEKSSEKLASDVQKTNINIRLKEKLTKDELTTLANKIKEQRASFNNVSIFYYLPDMEVGAGAWATTHFNPELEVKILGSTKEEENNLTANIPSVDGELIGNFFEQQYTNALYTVYEKNGKTFVRTTFKDGTNMIEETVKTGTTLKPVQNAHGEYYKLNSDVFEFYNKEDRMFTSAKPVK